MEELKWLEVSVNAAPEELEDVSAKLIAAGVTGLVVEDEQEFQQFLEQNRQYWDYVDEELLERMRGVCRVKFYVTDDPDGRSTTSPWRSAPGSTWSRSGCGRSLSPQGGPLSI